jgi:hypothetical protein
MTNTKAIPQNKLEHLAKLTQAVCSAMLELSAYAEEHGLGMSQEFCEAYPFTESFDLVAYSVGDWALSMTPKGQA